ncbi:MAG: hypothetical protein H6713_13015 [Myxococcales bacterium]|nr:hypothetical protein [Myxococcales bacterium]
MSEAPRADAGAGAAPSSAPALRDAGQGTRYELATTAQRVAWLGLAYVIAWALGRAAVRLVRRRRELLADLRRHAPLLVLLAAFLALCATIPAFLPIHDHNSYVARSDCARSLACDDDPRAAFSATTFHVYGALLRLAPHSARGFGLVSVLMTALAIGLLYALIRRVPRLGSDASGSRALAERAAIWAAACVALHPILLRTATSGIFWPYNIACLLAAGVAAHRAAERGAIVDALAAAVLLAFAVLGNLVCLALTPLVVLVPLCWGRLVGAGARRYLALALGVLVFAALVTPTFLDAFAAHVVQGQQMERFSEPPLRMLRELLGNVLYLDPRLTPAPLGVLALLGLVVLARRRARADLPFVYVLLATEVPLGLQVTPFTTGYPTRFIHGYPSLFWFAALAGLGAAALLRWLGERWPQARAWTLQVGLAALCLATIPTAGEALAFLGAPRVLERELAALERGFAELPEHDVLVLPPVILRPPEGVELTSDPVEAFFPVGAYRAAMRARGSEPVVAQLDELLRRPDGRVPEGRVLLYVGATMYSFVPAEIEAGLAARSIERPLLRRVRARYELEPAWTFTLATRQHPAVAMRLAADQREAVELGFYWLRARGADVASGSAPRPP